MKKHSNKSRLEWLIAHVERNGVYPYRWRYRTISDRDPIPYRLREQAMAAVAHALLTGRLIRPKHCDKYSKHCTGRIEAHHYKGYEPEHWLTVQWLCSGYHHARTRKKDKQKFKV